MSDLLATKQFDNAMHNGSITDDRGGIYGHPISCFTTISAIQSEIRACQCPSNVVEHALNMIAVKMTRLAISPDHIDSAIDIAGYARTICMIIDEQAKQGDPMPEHIKIIRTQRDANSGFDPFLKPQS